MIYNIPLLKQGIVAHFKITRRLISQKDKFNMFCIRQALRFSTYLISTRMTMYQHCAPIIYKLNDTRAFHHSCLMYEDDNNNKLLVKLEGKLKLMFTCKKCNTRNSKLISKLAYNKGVVIVRCEGCKNNHLIADNLGWFPQISNKINIEKLMALKGETVQKITNDVEGYFEAVTNEVFKLHQNENQVNQSKDQCFDQIKKNEISKDS